MTLYNVLGVELRPLTVFGKFPGERRGPTADFSRPGFLVLIR